MIKDLMTLPLSVDETNIKGTTAVFSTATDAEIYPYTIGYVPWKFIEKSTTYRKMLMGDVNANPGQFLTYNPETVISDNNQGLPFVYTVKQGLEGHSVNLYNPGTNYTQISWANNNNNMGILSAYNAQYYVSNNLFSDLKVNSIQLGFAGYETASQQEGWQGTAIGNLYPVLPINSFTVDAAINPAADGIELTFSYNLSSQYGTYTYTIDQSVFNRMWENGVILIEGGDYEYQGITYQRKLFLFIGSAALNLVYEAGAFPGYGTIIGENIRRTQFGYSSAYATKFQIEYNTSRQNQLIMSQEMINVDEEFPSQYGYFYSTSQSGPCIFRSAVAAWINHIVSGGMTWEDIIIMICTARPLYYLQDGEDSWHFYVAEFDDDYQITGKLILFDNAKDWQKNINGDTNEFDPEDIPTPEDDPTDYEDNPSTELHVGLFSSIGIDTYITSMNQFRGVYYKMIQELTNAQQAYIMALSQAQDYITISRAENEFKAIVSKLGGLNSNPINCINSVLAFPFDLTNYLASENTRSWLWGTVGILADDIGYTNFKRVVGINGSTSGIVNGGECTYFAEYKNFLDYEPYCSAEVYIPYCGSLAIDPKSYIGHKIKVKYLVDFNTGACVGLLYRDNLVVDQITGQMGMSIPMVATDVFNYNNSLFQGNQALKNSQTGAIAATIGAASTSANFIKSAIKDPTALTGFGSIASSMANVATSYNRMASAQYELATTQMPFKQISTASVATSTANEQKCRLVIYRPTFLDGYSKDDFGDYGHTTGFACLKNDKLKNYTGLTIASGLDTTGIQATEKEKEMIINAFQTGVYM